MKSSTWLGGRAATLAFAVLGGVVVIAAVRDRAREREAEGTRAAILASAAAAMAGPEEGARHVVLNGTTTRVFVTSAATEAERACGSGGVPFDDPSASRSSGEGAIAARFERERTHADVAADGSAVAVLCVVRAPSTGERRESMTLLRRVDAATTSAVTIARESVMDLATMFPLEGDAPGADPAGVPRPARTRRLVAATIVESRHDVWIYETEDSADIAMDAYDRRMSEAGFEIVRAAGSPARSYRRGDDELVAVFEPSSPARITMSRVRDRSAPPRRSSPRDGS